MHAIDMTDQLAIRAENDPHGYAHTDRDETIKAIRAALKRRTGLTWSVTGGRGTGWGWIEIQSPPKRRTGVHVRNADWRGGHGDPSDREWILIDSGTPQRFGLMTPADLKILGDALGLDRVHEQGVSIPASNDYRREYIARAEGRTPGVAGTPYWD